MSKCQSATACQIRRVGFCPVCAFTRVVTLSVDACIQLLVVGLGCNRTLRRRLSLKKLHMSHSSTHNLVFLLFCGCVAVCVCLCCIAFRGFFAKPVPCCLAGPTIQASAHLRFMRGSRTAAMLRNTYMSSGARPGGKLPDEQQALHT